jgi:hypothetical protein
MRYMCFNGIPHFIANGSVFKTLFAFLHLKKIIDHFFFLRRGFARKIPVDDAVKFFSGHGRMVAWPLVFKLHFKNQIMHFVVRWVVFSYFILLLQPDLRSLFPMLLFSCSDSGNYTFLSSPPLSDYLILYKESGVKPLLLNRYIS